MLVSVQDCAVQHAPELQALSPTHEIEQDGPLHAGGKVQATAPWHSMSHEDPLQVMTVLEHACCPAHDTLQSPLPHLIFPAGHAPPDVHSMSQSVPALQSTPWKHASVPQVTLHGIPAGQTTGVVHELCALQLIKHVSPRHVPVVHAARHAGVGAASRPASVPVLASGFTLESPPPPSVAPRPPVAPATPPELAPPLPPPPPVALAPPLPDPPLVCVPPLFAAPPVPVPPMLVEPPVLAGVPPLLTEPPCPEEPPLLFEPPLLLEPPLPVDPPVPADASAPPPPAGAACSASLLHARRKSPQARAR
jgi:hypothetical protein